MNFRAAADLRLAAILLLISCELLRSQFVISSLNLFVIPNTGVVCR